MVVACATLPGLASGVLATPDTALGLAWVLALHEGLAALRGERRRWLSAGIATGLGLLSKYTMVLMGPVFLWAILWADPKALRTPWPYLGGLVVFLVFGPNLLWNAQNDWLTIRFQFGPGFSTETGTLVTNSLPVPTGDHKVATALSPEQHSVAEGLGGPLDFFGTQIALWGLPAFAVVASLFRGRGAGPKRELTVLDPAAKALLVAGSLFPLAFFALVATFSEVEPNWPVMYLWAAAPLVALAAARLLMWMMVAAGGNLLLVGLYVLHGACGYPALTRRLQSDLAGNPRLFGAGAKRSNPARTSVFRPVSDCGHDAVLCAAPADNPMAGHIAPFGVFTGHDCAHCDPGTDRAGRWFLVPGPPGAANGRYRALVCTRKTASFIVRTTVWWKYRRMPPGHAWIPSIVGSTSLTPWTTRSNQQGAMMVGGGFHISSPRCRTKCH